MLDDVASAGVVVDEAEPLALDAVVVRGAEGGAELAEEGDGTEESEEELEAVDEPLEVDEAVVGSELVLLLLSATKPMASFWNWSNVLSVVGFTAKTMPAWQ